MNATPEHTYYAIDLDRTLLDTVTLTRRYIDTAETYSPHEPGTLTLDALDFWVHQEAAGESFNVRGYLRSRGLGDAALLDIESTILESSTPKEFLNEDAGELLRLIGERALGFSIVTYGPTDTQRFKLRAAGLLHLPHMITDTPDKSIFVREWQQPSGTFAVPVAKSRGGVVSAASVCLIDDKTQAFEGLPEVARGYWLQNGRTIPANTLPANVVPVDSLASIIRQEFPS